MKNSLNDFMDFVKAHKFEVICALIAVIIGIVFLIIGFWKTLFLLFFAACGFYIGKRIDSGMSISDIFNDFISRIKKIFK